MKRWTVGLAVVVGFLGDPGAAQAAITITFAEGLAPVGQHGLTTQYRNAYGVWFAPGATSNNNWSLFGGSIYGSSIGDGYSAYISAGDGDILFRQAVDYVELDLLIQGGFDSIDVVMTALDTDANPLAVSHNTILVDSDVTEAVLATVRIDAPGLIEHLRVTRPRKWSVDTLRFAPEIPEIPEEPHPVIPEPSTFIIWSLLGALGITLGWCRRRRAA